jgi:hypothetical protein
MGYGKSIFHGDVKLPFRQSMRIFSGNRQDHRWIEEGHEEFVAGYGSDPQAGWFISRQIPATFEGFHEWYP